MQRVLVGILFVLAAYPEARAEVVWSGGSGVRYVERVNDDGLAKKITVAGGSEKDRSKSTTRAWNFKGNLGVSSKGDDTDWGVDVRTQPAGSVNSEWLTVQGNADYAIGLSQAYVRFRKNFWDTDWAVTVGRAKTVLFYDNLAQSLFDNDIRWDGFGWTIKHGIFGLNASQYVLGALNQGTAGTSQFSHNEETDSGAQTQSRFGVLYSIQPWVQFKFGEDITSTLALAYHIWNGTGGNTGTAGGNGTGWYSNALHGGSGASTNESGTNTNPVVMDNARQWQVLSDTAFLGKFRFVGEFVRNKKTVFGTRANPTNLEALRDAWALSLFYGKPKKAGEYSFGYSYGKKGLGSVINTFSNGDVNADNKSHFFEAKYFLADGLSFTGKAQFHREISKVGGDGVALAAPNNGREQSQKRFEFVTTIQY